MAIENFLLFIRMVPLLYGHKIPVIYQLYYGHRISCYLSFSYYGHRIIRRGSYYSHVIIRIDDKVYHSHIVTSSVTSIMWP